MGGGAKTASIIPIPHSLTAVEVTVAVDANLDWVEGVMGEVSYCSLCAAPQLHFDHMQSH